VVGRLPRWLEQPCRPCRGSAQCPWPITQLSDPRSALAEDLRPACGSAARPASFAGLTGSSRAGGTRSARPHRRCQTGRVYAAGRYLGRRRLAELMTAPIPMLFSAAPHGTGDHTCWPYHIPWQRGPRQLGPPVERSWEVLLACTAVVCPKPARGRRSIPLPESGAARCEGRSWLDSSCWSAGGAPIPRW